MSCNEWKEIDIGRIPSHWDYAPMNKYVEINMGQSPKSEFYNTIGEGLPFLQGNRTFGLKYPYYDTYSSDIKKRAQVGDILFSVRAPVGDVNIATEEICIGRGIASLKMKKGNQEYLYYLLRGFRKYIENRENGTVFGSINKKGLEDLKLPFPPLKEQENIANILSSLDDKIELNNEMNKTLEEMAQSIFKRWFIDFEFPNEYGEPYKSNGGEMVDSELGMIPKGWEVKKLESIIEKIIDNRGKTPPREEIGIPLVEGNNITLFDSYINLTPKQKYVSKETYDNWFRSGHPEYLDILCATVGTLPKWCFVSKNDKICVAQNIIAIRVNRNIVSPYYLKNYMDTNRFIQMFNGRITTTAQPSIKVGHLTSIDIVVPSLEIIKKYDDIVDNIYNSIESRKMEIENLIELRDSLLPKLMSGEISAN